MIMKQLNEYRSVNVGAVNVVDVEHMAQIVTKYEDLGFTVVAVALTGKDFEYAVRYYLGTMLIDDLVKITGTEVKTIDTATIIGGK